MTLTISGVLGVGKGGKGSVHDAVTCFKPPAGKLSAVAFFGLERLGSPAAFDWQAKRNFPAIGSNMNWCSKLHWLDPAVWGSGVCAFNLTKPSLMSLQGPVSCNWKYVN